ncbi:MAG: IS1595 family transposase, partial [Armatimonadetes bacterium CG_4_8_14_3_um_filter_66_20]
MRWPEGFRCPRCEGARSGSTNRGLPHCLHCDVQT